MTKTLPINLKIYVNKKAEKKMRTFLLLTLLIINSLAFAGAIDDIFDPGNKEFIFERFTDNKILLIFVNYLLIRRLNVRLINLDL